MQVKNKECALHGGSLFFTFLSDGIRVPKNDNRLGRLWFDILISAGGIRTNKSE